jgi:hypothetical protein
MDYPYHIETPVGSFLLLETWGKVGHYQLLVDLRASKIEMTNHWIKPLSSITDTFNQASGMLVGLRESSHWVRIGKDVRVAHLWFVDFTR